MKLETVRIKRFRSIEEVSLEGIGNLNVLIGKNNSGKSNILLSIDTFFACMKGDSLVTAEPPIGNDIDYFGKRTREPIEIELSADQTKLVENAWSQDKLSLVPGDLLLDGVCQAFGVRFRKEADSSRAAALLNQSEIDDEIRQILQEIGSPT